MEKGCDKCDDLFSPTFSDLQPGTVRPIYLQRDDGTYKYEGDAILEKYLFDQQLPQIEHVCCSCGSIINWTRSKWLVQFENGFRTNRYVDHFHSTGNFTNITYGEEEE